MFRAYLSSLGLNFKSVALAFTNLLIENKALGFVRTINSKTSWC